MAKHPDSVSGIYAIICRVNGKKYYGSSYNCRNRKSHHWSDLRHNRHKNIHLQRAWNKYGAAAFDFVVVQRVPLANLLEVESQYLPFGDYNIFRDAERPSNVAPIERICRWCDKHFLAQACNNKNGRRKFCSMKCYQAEHKGETEVRTCKKCHKRFRTYSKRVRDGRGRYCSKVCSSHRGELVSQKCDGCENRFVAYAKDNRKFCSPRCYWTAKRTTKRRPCQQCGIVFLPRSHSAALKFCSRKCFFKSLAKSGDKSVLQN